MRYLPSASIKFLNTSNHLQLKMLFTLLLFSFFLPNSRSQYTLDSQDDVNNFNPNIENIFDFLVIGDDQYATDITDISNLANLKTIGGNLAIRNTQLVNIDALQSISSIGGGLVVTENPNLTNIDALSSISTLEALFLELNFSLESVGLDSLKTIENHVIIEGNAINDLNGLQNVTTIGDYLLLQGNPELTSTSGMSNLSSIGDDVRIHYHASLTDIDFLSKLISINGDLIITSNFVLPNVDGLSKITSVAGEIKIENNNALEELGGLSNLRTVADNLYIRDNDELINIDGLFRITATGSSLYITNNAKLPNVDGLSNLLTIDGRLRITDNDVLKNLDGFFNLTNINGDLRITSNDLLSDCCGIQHLLDSTANSVSGSIEISNNPASCSSVEEVTNASCGSCWENDALAFCVLSGKWEAVEGVQNKITTNGLLSVNDFLYFQGTMTIDTVDLEITAQGEFFVDNIPIPGGGIGKYALSNGSYDLKFLGTDGSITNFLNAEISERGKIFNTELKLDKLQLVKNNNATGLKITCTIKVPGISGGCEDGSGVNTEIQLDGLGITTGGITLDGVNVKDLGMYVPAFCLKQLSVNYNAPKDILKAGASVSMPFGQVDGGFKLEEGLIDSIGWLLEANVAPFILGTTTIGIKGFFGHISNITKPTIEVELGGIFSDIISDDLYRITASGKTVWPTEFEIAGTGQFIRPVLNTLPFQLQGGVSLGYNIPNSLLNVKVDGKFGTLDEQNWLISGNGLLRVNHRTETTKFNGYMNGMMNVTTDVFVNDPPMPIPYVTSILGLPFSAETKNIVHYGDRKNFFGSITMDHFLLGKFNLGYVIDLILPMDDPDYFFWHASREEAFASPGTSRADQNPVDVPEDIAYTIIHIESETSPPVSTITSPSGAIFTSSSQEDRILYSDGINGKESFWTILDPEAGTWIVTLENPAPSDDVYYYNGEAVYGFDFTVEQEGNTINVSWDATELEPGDVVFVSLNDNHLEFNGFRVAETAATSGQVSFMLDNTTPDCQYYVYAELVEGMNVQQVYSDQVLYNAEGTLAPPQNFKAEYISESTGFDFSWNGNPSADIAGYIITVMDDDGQDSVIATLNPDVTSITLVIEDYEVKAVRIESFDVEWRVGCPATIDGLYQGCLSASTNLAATICQGASYMIGDQIFSEPGDYSVMLTTSGGCDSLVELNLTVIDLEDGINIIGNTMTANEAYADSYRWIDCDSGEEIIGANQRSFTPDQTGIYAVRIEKNGCEVISECQQIITAVKDLAEVGVRIFPNPVSHALHISGLQNRSHSAYATFFNNWGKSSRIPIMSSVINTSELLPGIYTAVLNVEERNYYTRVVIMR